jgi:2-keto-3-deoxy-L-rhamnonate aldolase RhmA
MQEARRLTTVRLATLIRTTEATQLDAVCASGLGWLMLDGEHTGVGLNDLAEMLHGINGRLPSYVRVRSLDADLIHHALAHGAIGVIIPHVDSGAQADEGVRIVRTSQWPTASVVVQAESVEAVRNIDEIVAVSGVEWVLIGPYDLAKSMGIPGQIEAPEFDAAVRMIETGCARAGVPVGIFGMTPDRVAPYLARGYEWVVVGIDRPA